MVVIMNKLISIILCFILIISFSFSVFAYDPYGNVSENTSQIQILISAMLNDSAFTFNSKWVAFRESENVYAIYFNVDPEEFEASFYKYTGVTSGYNTQWTLTRGESDSFVIPDFDRYTSVGSFDQTLYSSAVDNYKSYFYVRVCLLFLTFGVLFFIFRIRKRGINL